MIKTFKTFFNNSENHRGFFEVWNLEQPDKLASLIGEYETDDLKIYDMNVNAKIGDCYIAPLLHKIDTEYTDLVTKQSYIIDTFLLLHYNELLLLKKAMATDIPVENGNTRTEKRNNDFETVDGTSAYNTDDFSDTEKRVHTEKNKITETNIKNNTDSIIHNISSLTEFYKSNIIDKIIEYVKELYTLGVM